MDRLSDAIASLGSKFDQHWARVFESTSKKGEIRGKLGKEGEKTEDKRQQVVKMSVGESPVSFGPEADVASQPPVLQSRGQPRVGEAQGQRVTQLFGLPSVGAGQETRLREVSN